MNVFRRFFKEKIKSSWIKRAIRLNFGRHSAIKVAIEGEVYAVHDISLSGIGVYTNQESDSMAIGTDTSVSIMINRKILDTTCRVVNQTYGVMGLEVSSPKEIYQKYINEYQETLKS
jgi:hypothetical protein